MTCARWSMESTGPGDQSGEQSVEPLGPDGRRSSACVRTPSRMCEGVGSTAVASAATCGGTAPPMPAPDVAGAASGSSAGASSEMGACGDGALPAAGESTVDAIAVAVGAGAVACQTGAADEVRASRAMSDAVARASAAMRAHLPWRFLPWAAFAWCALRWSAFSWPRGVPCAALSRLPWFDCAHQSRSSPSRSEPCALLSDAGDALPGTPAQAGLPVDGRLAEALAAGALAVGFAAG